MRAYVLITGALFGLLVVVHIWRLVVEGPVMARNLPWVVLTLAAAGLCLWACRLLWGRGD